MAVRKDLEIIKGDSFERTITVYEEAYWNYRGEWSSLADYEEDDVVVRKNNAYICLADHTSAQDPVDEGSPEVYWSTPTAYNFAAPAHTITGKIRSEDYDDSGSPQASFTLNWITDGSDGQFKITLSAATTAAWEFKKGQYDIEVTNGTDTWKEITGVITVLDEVTY